MSAALRRFAGIALLLGAATGCHPDPGPGPTSAEAVTLEVSATDHSGWESPTGEPEVDTQTATLAEGDSLTVATFRGDVTITVESIDDGSVALSTSEPLIDTTGAGGIDFDDAGQAFTVAHGDTIELSTPTMDASTVIEITVTG